MRAERGLPPVHHQHPPGPPRRTDPMRHDDQRTTGPLPPREGPLRALLRLRIEMTGRLVEESERRVRQIGPRQRDQLPFAGGERRRVHRGVGPAEGVEQRRQPYGLRRGQQLRLRYRVRPQMAEILGEGPAEDVGLLGISTRWARVSDTGRPYIRIVPWPGSSSPAASAVSVDLPIPLGPTTAR